MSLLLQVHLAGRVAAQQLRQVGTEGGARHDHVAASFLRLQLQVALHVRDEADDVGVLLQPRLQLGDERERLRRVAVQVEDDQRRVAVAVLVELFEEFFAGLDELDLDVQLARRLLDLGHEEQVVNERIDLGRAVVARRERLDFLVLEEAGGSGHAAASHRAALALAVVVALLVAIAMVHGASEGLAIASAAVSLAVLMLAGLAVGTVGRATTTAAAPATPSMMAALATGRVLRSCIHVVSSLRPRTAGDVWVPAALREGCGKIRSPFRYGGLRLRPLGVGANRACTMFQIQRMGIRLESNACNQALRKIKCRLA